VIGVLLMLVSVSAAVMVSPISHLKWKHDTNEEYEGPGTEIMPEEEVEPESVRTFQDHDCGELKSFSNSEEFREYTEVSSQELREKLNNTRWHNWYVQRLTGASTTVAMAEADSVEYSDTNIQVEGVDEPDRVKTDGEYLYVKSRNEIVILKVYPGKDAEVLSRIETTIDAREMFVSESKLVLFESNYGKSSIVVYDISSRSSPTLIQNLSFDQRYFNSRLIGDHAYVVFQGEFWHWDYDPVTRKNERVFKLPYIVNNGETTTVNASGICYFDVPAPEYSLTLVASLNLQDGILKYKVYLTDRTHNMYVSRQNIYLTSWDYTPLRDRVSGYRQSTMIHKISIDEGEIKYEGNGSVPGRIIDQFAMDEYEGHFRVATSEGYTQTNVYVLNENLETVGELEGLAPDETMYSSRFIGDRGYLVTFKKVDPFFVIDLSNPESPKVLGELKIPGFSNYLHPYDENHMIGLGLDTYDMGRFAWYQGVKLSLFDVTDVENPQEISKYIIGDRGTYSSALSDHKAFMFSESKNLLMMPISLYEINESKYPDGAPPETRGEFVWQGAYIFSLTLEKGFELKGRISHLENENDLMNYEYCYHSGSWSWYQQDKKSRCVFRTGYIGNEIYTISEGMVKINSMGSLDEIKAIEL
jgi:uncharacterized secreted protein with C-terminal beta-propeller domain